jgi:chromosome segregation ATPase
MTVSPATSGDFPAIGEVLLNKLSAIEQRCNIIPGLSPSKYDPQRIRDKIAAKRQQLADLEAENAALAETLKQQERALHDPNPDLEEGEPNSHRLRRQLAAAQGEVKSQEERRHGLLAENRRLKAQIQATRKAFAAAAADQEDAATTEDELNATLAQLEKKQKEIDARRQREQTAYEKKMQSLKEERERLLEEKAALEQKLRDKQKELEMIQATATKSHFPSQIRRK